jgi:hypothetical protein
LHRDLFLLSLAAHGLADAKIMRAGMALGPIAFDRATDRSVLGSMNIAISDLDPYLQRFPHLLELDPAATALYLNKRPVTIKGFWHSPGREMLARVTGITG